MLLEETGKHASREVLLLNIIFLSGFQANQILGKNIVWDGDHAPRASREQSSEGRSFKLGCGAGFLIEVFPFMPMHQNFHEGFGLLKGINGVGFQ